MLYNTDIGLLILRLGFGLNMAVMNGWGKISAGPEMWRKVGSVMPSFGHDSLTVFWGFMAAFAEFGCTVLVALGLYFRPALFLLVFTMGMAMSVHLGMPEGSPRGGWQGATPAFLYLLAFLGLFVSGPGRYRLAFGKK